MHQVCEDHTSLLHEPQWIVLCQFLKSLGGGGGIPKRKSLGQGGCKVWPCCIVGMSSKGVHFTHHKAQVEHYNKSKHLCGQGRFLCLFPKSERDFTHAETLLQLLRSRCKIPLLFLEGNLEI
jgi:hypothetical protein